MEIPVIGTQEAGPQLRALQASGQRAGILFGPEKAGLTNDDVVLCDQILTYPINPAFQSLNLAQAVAVFSYIWGSSANSGIPEVFDQDQAVPASKEDLVRMCTHLEDELDAAGFFFPPEKKDMMRRNIRAPFIRAQMSRQEVQTMRGMIKALAKGRGRHLK